MFGSGIIILGLLIVSSLFAHRGSQREADSMKTLMGDS
jgi:hypothetical protein